MAPFYLILALLVQCSLCYAEDGHKNETESIEVMPEVDESQKVEKNDTVEQTISSIDEKPSAIDENENQKTNTDDVLLKEFRTATNDWVDMFLGASSDSNPSSSTSLMAQATNSNKTPEEQLEEIKEVANEITMAIQNEMTNLLSYALNYVDKDGDDNKLRKKRSVETPMDSSQLVMRLLNHIKSNNEYQNVAIEKMMSAQQIADKYGVEFNPDPEILTDFAFAANEQAKELTSILEEACSKKNSSSTPEISTPVLNTSYYTFSSDYPDIENMTIPQSHEHTYQSLRETNHVHYGDNRAGYNYYNYQCDNQIPSSSSAAYPYGSSVTPKPTFYDSISYNPNEYYSPYCSVDPMPLYSFDEPLDLEPELVGEEYEETVSSKVIIEQDEEPGSATVNHIMTYTVSEKAHFKNPQIEKLPQQMQYYFLLM